MTPGHLLLAFLVAVGWVGHACLWTALLNVIYGLPVPKAVLKPWRLFTGLVILSFPLLVLALRLKTSPNGVPYPDMDGIGAVVVWSYLAACVLQGGLVFPAITAYRLLRPRPRCVLAERTETVDYWKELGPAALGDGKQRNVTRLPGNCVFRVDFTDLTVAVPDLPAAWDGLTILLLSDIHFTGTPSRAFFDRVFDRLTAGPPPDLVVLAGDYLDTDRHHAWIGELFGRLSAMEGKFAILGNHDRYRDPERVRKELADAGCTVLGNGWREATIRGVRCVVVGHEGPWFRPGPDLSVAPPGLFRLCVSHTPDNFYWGQRNRIGLMLCGHVHGGQIRVPVIGSIFIPSIYGRRFDQGVFLSGPTLMVIGRGLSGKEPLRFHCHPQAIRLTLRLSSAEESPTRS